MTGDQAKLNELRHERSLVIIKPDGVIRHLVGEIISRFERKGLKIVAMKLVHPTQKQVEEHYALDEEWLESNGNRTLKSYKARGVEINQTARELGLNTRRKLMEYLGAGPVVALVLEGAHVIENVRKIRGATNPLDAEAGSIGFDFTLDSFALSDAGDWATRNIIHGSDSPESVAREIPIWFQPNELVEYTTAMENIIYGTDWHMKPKAE